MFDDIILKFIRDDVGGILITDTAGKVLYSDDHSVFVKTQKTNWKSACPPPRMDQHSEVWDLLITDTNRTYLVVTSTYATEDGMIQVHMLVDTSMYTELFNYISGYSRDLKFEKERDSLTGLYNKGKYLELKDSAFLGQKTIVVFNMDVNNLKQMNDHYGHEAGDKLIQKAADSLKAIGASNVIPFRVGGDEFAVVATNITRQEADNILRDWEAALKKLNDQDDGIFCVLACGMAYGEGNYDLDQIMDLADQRMYEDKKKKKLKDNQEVR